MVTRNAGWSADGVETAASLPDALARAALLDDDVFIVGGGQIYAQALATDAVDLLCITRVAAAPEGDTTFPPIDWEQWQPVARMPHATPAADDTPSFEIVTYQRA